MLRALSEWWPGPSIQREPIPMYPGLSLLDYSRVRVGPTACDVVGRLGPSARTLAELLYLVM